MLIALLIGTATGIFFVAAIVVCVSIGMSLSQNGCLFHEGWKLYGKNMLLLVADMEKHPDDYTVDHFTLESKDLSIWIANGFTFYKDYDRFTSGGTDRVRIGTLSVGDRLLLSQALRKFKTTSPLDFELALRRKNGLMGK